MPLRPEFLIFENPEYGEITGEKIPYSSVDIDCKRFYAIENVLKVENVPEITGYYLTGYYRY